MGKYVNYSQEDLDNAIEAVRSGHLSKRKAAVTYVVPRQTLLDKINHIHLNPIGHPTMLSRAVETILATLLIFMLNIGFGLNKHEVCEVVKNYRIESNQRDIFAGQSTELTNRWYYGFLSRHEKNNLTFSQLA